MQGEFDDVNNYLPSEISYLLSGVRTEIKQKTSEIRLRRNRPVMLTVEGKTVEVNKEITDDRVSAIINTDGEMIRKTVKLLSDGSLYTKSDEIKNGYISFGKGHRAGVCGEAVTENGRIIAVNNITSINIRIAHNAEPQDDIFSAAEINDGSVIIASPPGGGKTTALRYLARRYSEIGKRVAVVDERGEMNGFFLGNNTDILANYPKKIGMEIAVRSMSPDVIICDEITPDEAETISFASNCGVKVIATIHAKTADEIIAKTGEKTFFRKSSFKTLIILSDSSEPCRIKETVNTDDIFL